MIILISIWVGSAVARMEYGEACDKAKAYVIISAAPRVPHRLRILSGVEVGIQPNNYAKFCFNNASIACKRRLTPSLA